MFFNFFASVQALVAALLPELEDGGVPFSAAREKRARAPGYLYICDARPRLNAITNKGKVCERAIC